MPRNRCTAMHSPGLFAAAHARYLRRCQLWHAARLACDDDVQFRAAWHSIADAVADQLAREFPTL